MKKYLLLALLCCRACTLIGQKIVQQNLPLAAGERLDLNLRFADSIRVTAWDKNEVSIRVVVTINNNQLNEAFKMDINRTTTGLAVDTNFDKELIKESRPEDCPGTRNNFSGSQSVDKDGQVWSNGGNSVCADIYFEIKVPRRAEVKLETISGNIVIRQWEGRLLAKSISGFVDLALPAGRGAEVSLKTISGEAYSDMDVDIAAGQRKNEGVGYNIRGKIAGGGPLIKLESISGNLYLRRE